MHLVIGANGRVGRLVAEELIKAGERPRVFVRAANKAYNYFGDRVEIAPGDLEDKDSVKKAMYDISRVFLCSPINPNQVSQQNAVVDNARRSKAYIVKVSGLATFTDSFVDSGRWHAETEKYMASQDVAYTCLHPFFFMQNLGFLLAAIKANGVLESAIGSAAIAMVDTRDVASVAAKLMLNPDLAVGQTLPLTCGEAMNYRQIAKLMSGVFEREVTFRQQTLKEVEENLRRSGVPKWHIQIILQFNQAFAEGYGSKVHSDVREITGRAPLSLRDYLKTAAISGGGSNPFPN